MEDLPGANPSTPRDVATIPHSSPWLSRFVVAATMVAVCATTVVWPWIPQDDARSSLPASEKAERDGPRERHPSKARDVDTPRQPPAPKDEEVVVNQPAEPWVTTGIPVALALLAVWSVIPRCGWRGRRRW